MPYRPKTFNLHRSMGNPIPDHAALERKNFYNSGAWKRLRLAYLRSHPLCVDCETIHGKLTPATTPHHIKERLLHPDLALDEGNLLALCVSCHTKRHKSR